MRPRDEIIGAFAALDVYLIRPDLRRLDPDYLAAFLARPDVGMQLRLSTAGASLPRIPKSALADLELPLPDLVRQRAIGGLCRSLGLRARLYDRLKAAETRLTDYYLDRSFAQLRRQVPDGRRPTGRHPQRRMARLRHVSRRDRRDPVEGLHPRLPVPQIHQRRLAQALRAVRRGIPQRPARNPRSAHPPPARSGAVQAEAVRAARRERHRHRDVPQRLLQPLRTAQPR